MVLLRVTVLVMDLLPDQQQDAVPGDTVISLQTLYQHVMIRDDDYIQPCFNGRMGDILVSTGAIRVAGMHVQVDDDFVH